GAAPADKNLAKLECVTSQYQVPTWDTARTMQFDASGKLYFRATTMNNPQGVFMQYDPTTKQLTEKVNANICWQDVQVTPRGSLFYTGMSMTNGQCGGSGTTGAFFRYVSADNKLTEIARNWWDFKYLAKQDPNDPNNEKIIFYGPDPNASGDASWNTACLYQYDPSVTTAADRTTKLVDCAMDGNSYVSGSTQMGMQPTPTADQVPGYVERCESSGQLFINGNSVTALSQLQDGTLFVVGNFQRKLAAEAQCMVNVTVDHCALTGNNINDGLDAEHTNRADCEGAGHVWITVVSSCSNGVDQDQNTCQTDGGTWYWGMGTRGYNMTGAACEVSGDGIALQNIQCVAPNNGPLSDQITGLAYVVPGTDGGLGEIRLLSDPTEQVERYWPIPGANGPELYYSVYSSGQYSLRRVTQIASGEGGPQVERQDVLDDFEVYNLQRDPSHQNRVMLDALEFSTNSYVFGSIDPTLDTPEAVQNSLQVLNGVSGKIDTLIILPNF
ncbi:MAG TPA: hypothetical protein VG963_04585, partial [Polyangiaceae bacterium]|nr:hypothetical protein [Polyangiaceae bacterium]